MRSHFLFIYLLFFVIFFTGSSCRKENIQNSPKFKYNTVPRISKGNDVRLFLPTDFAPYQINVTDSEKNVKEIIWKKIAGPDTFRVENKSKTYHNNSTFSTVSLFSNLVLGTYDFELTVIDSEGLFDKDTISLIVSKTNISAGTELNFHDLSWTPGDWWYYHIIINDFNSLVPVGNSFKIYIKGMGNNWQEVPLATSSSIYDWPYTYFVKDNGKNLYVYYDYWFTNLGMGDNLHDTMHIKIVY